MKPSEFKGQNIVMAEHQDEYLSLPAFRNETTDELTFCWKATWRERVLILFYGVVWHRVLTFGNPLQPQIVQADEFSDVIK